ncbi:MAG: sulfotransferase domain-containing protein [Moorea sp. SIO4E2]|uniref:sulfotransferase domain-containing protein n=1 Tax=Moorena sp. SIO4E2 TaxID=2607826 RepID=UPI0013BB79D8|nr:sulfotransferase domain-containing protein [Moorena sp. SIO4E2]NEQ09159.1 sulfotransferase domain-containing protein [Moorena sp. SIO4E2]
MTPDKEKRLKGKNESDFFLISFPKCGRTWLRLMLGRVFQMHFKLKDANILELDKLRELHPDIPKICVSHDDKPQWKKPDELVTSKAEYQDKRVIFLVRDPRDAIVSNYYQKTKRRQAYDGSLSEFIREENGSFATLILFYNIWAENREVPQDFLLVRYEDIHRDRQKELRRMLHFLGLPEIADDLIAKAGEYAIFENMRKMEVENKFNSPRMSAVDPGDINSYKTRRGKVGGFKDNLSTADIDYLNCIMKESLSVFYGYEV